MILLVRVCICIASVLILFSMQAVANPKKASFAGLTAHVFLENSGKFTRPIGQIKEFITWNFKVTGVGIPQGERFHSVLLKIMFRSKGEIFAEGAQAIVSVQERGRKRVRRYVIKHVYIGPSGLTHHPVLVRDIGCLPLLITVSSHGRVYRRTLNFRCGE